MKIAIDVDDVLFDFMVPLNEFYNEKYGKKYALKDYNNYRLDKVWCITLPEAIDIVYEFYNTDAFKEIKPARGAVDVVKRLASEHELFVVTSRPESINHITDYQINKYFDGCFKEIHSTGSFKKDNAGCKDKSHIFSMLKTDLVIEDCLKNVTELPNNMRGFLIDRPWNQGALPRNVQRTYNWIDILKSLQRAV